MRIKTLCLFVFVASIGFGQSLRAMDLRSYLGGVTGGDRGMGLLVSDIDFRKGQLEELKKEKEAFEKKANDAVRTINTRLQGIDDKVKTATGEIQKASGSHEELLKKKVALLNERKQNLLDFQDLWKEVEGKIARHIKLENEIIEYLESKVTAEKDTRLYSWKDLDEVKNKIDHLRSELASENRTRDNLREEKSTEKSDISFFKKDIETKTAEKEKVDGEYSGLTEQEVIFAQELRAKSNLIQAEIDKAREKIEISQFKIEDLSREERYKDDEIFLLKQKINQENSTLLKIQKRVRIELADVASVKEELALATKEASGKSIALARRRASLKVGRSGLHKSFRNLERDAEAIRKQGREKSVEGHLINSRLAAIKNEKLVVDRELDLLKTQKEDLDASVLVKELKARVIEILHKLNVGTEKLEEWLTEFRSRKRGVVDARRVLRGKREELDSFLSTINKEQESLEAKQKEIKGEEDSVFAGRGRDYFETMTNLDRAVKWLSRQKRLVERHGTRVSELLLRHEEVINQYNFIIKYLESERLIGIWKRSPRAISLQQVGVSLLEGEKFFKDLFWDTPAHLGPTNIIVSVKTWDFVDILGFLLFFLIFVLLYVGFRLLLVFARKNSRRWLGKLSERLSHAFVAGVENLLDFFLNHFGLIFTWLFVYVHVALGLTYFRPLANMYAVTLFYLLSVPALMYLSHRFVVRLKKLNQELGYLFIAESAQRKFMFLIELFLYATAILLPLRRAFLEHFEGDIAFPDVSLAAYTLILIIVILFFFNKEDILRLLSSRNAIVVWLHKKVDRYYYPVFGFLMLLLILSNSYIGYSNLAWYLAFAIPASISLVYGLLFIHYLIRKYSLFFFIKEEDDEVVNKFDHAKAYYGFFVAVSFIALVLATLVIFARLWGVEGYTLSELWRSLSEDWVIGKGTKTPLGFVELFKFGMFLIGGLVISSFIKKFVLGKLFEIFRTEPGVQNTVSMILHYIIIILAVILGFTAINLSQLALTAGGLLLVGVGFGLKDQIVDYFGGVLVLLERPLEIGHYVETGEFQGKVHRISARSTTLKTARNLFITIPNRELISKPIINWGQGRYAVGAELRVMVAYDSDPDLVKKVLLEVMSSHSTVLRVPAPVVRFEGFESSALFFYCRCFVSSRKVLEMWELQSDLRAAVIKAFQENAIVIPYSQTVVHFANNCKKQHAKPVGEAVGQQVPIDIKFDK